MDIQIKRSGLGVSNSEVFSTGHSENRDNQGYNAWEVISEVYASFVLQCTLGDNVNTRRMSKTDMGSILHIKNQ